MDQQERRHERPSILSNLIAPYVIAAGTVTASPAMRKLAILTIINALGNGLFATINILFYTHLTYFYKSLINNFQIRV